MVKQNRLPYQLFSGRVKDHGFILPNDYTMPIKQATLSDAAKLNILVNSAYRGEISRQGWTTEADFLDGTWIDEVAICELIAQPETTILKYEERGIIAGCVAKCSTLLNAG